MAIWWYLKRFEEWIRDGERINKRLRLRLRLRRMKKKEWICVLP
jgi:hypothetical protein